LVKKPVNVNCFDNELKLKIKAKDKRKLRNCKKKTYIVYNISSILFSIVNLLTLNIII